MSKTNSRAIYRAVRNGVIYKTGNNKLANKLGKRAEVRYLQNQFETTQQLIESMIEESQK